MSDLAFLTDGSAAVVGLVLGLIDMGMTHCPENGCLARNDRQAFTAISAGEVVFQEDGIGEELHVRRQTGTAWGPFQTTYGASVTNDGSLWVGLGSTTTYTTPNDRWYAQFHAMPGLYARGDGADLGGPIVFRSGVELGYENRGGVRMGVGVDHRSNAGLYSDNPGLETVYFRVSIPTN